MKANPAPAPASTLRAAPILFSSPRTALAIAAAMLFTAGCVPQKAPPPPAPAPAPRPAPAPLPAPTLDWRDAPITPGDWSWRMEGGQSVASFAADQLILRCDPASRTVTLQRPGAGQSQVAFSVITSSTTRQLAATPQAGSPPVLSVSLPARDPVLDAMAFSRGRFAVQTGGLPTLYVPSWPEVSRVVEDCR